MVTWFFTRSGIFSRFLEEMYPVPTLMAKRLLTYGAGGERERPRHRVKERDMEKETEVLMRA